MVVTFVAEKYLLVYITRNVLELFSDVFERPLLKLCEHKIISHLKEESDCVIFREVIEV